VPPARPRLTRVTALAFTAALLAACSPPDDAAPATTSTSPSSGAESPSPAVTSATLTTDGIELLLSVPLGAGEGSTDDDGLADDGTDTRGEEASAEDATADAPTETPITVTPDEDGSRRVAFTVPVGDSTVSGSASSGAGEAAGAPSGESARASDGAATGGPTTGAPAAPPAMIDLVSPADGSLLRNGDGSLTVLDAAGTPLGGFSAPQATDDAGAGGSSGFLVVAPNRAEVHVKARGATSSGGPQGAAAGWTVTTWLGAQGVRSATWGEREGGRSLAVDPTPWARQSGIVGEATAWAQLVASEPEADSRTMRDQFDCHALGAPDKATWNLEPWRPDVGFLATAAARCNPT
jgi:hypothetical protein